MPSSSRRTNDVLIQLREDTSIYDLCKRIASHPGYPPEDGGLPAKRDELKRSLDVWGRVAPGKRLYPLRMWQLAPLPAVQKQKEDLRRRLDMVAHVLGPDLRVEVSEALRQLEDSNGYVKEALASLTVIASRVAIHPRHTELLDLDAGLRSAAHTLATLPDEARLRELNLDRLAEMERHLAEHPGLALACEDAARAVLGDCRTELISVTERFTTQRHAIERIRAVRPLVRSAHPAARDSDETSNTILGPVYGTTVQARAIDALHLHIHADSEHTTPAPPDEPCVDS